MSDRAKAGVRFEFDRWDETAIAAAIAREVAELFGWLESVTLTELVTVEQVLSLVRSFAVEAPPAEWLAPLLERAVEDARAALLHEDARLADLISRADYDELAVAIGGLGEVRREIVGQVTTSAVYSRLISHVLYHGIKNYLLTQNVVVRNVPGASSLMRLGQNVVRTATPNLEKGIDRTLTAFVRATVHESIRDSQDFLEDILDEAMIRTIADEIWAQNSGRGVAELAGLVSGPALPGLVGPGVGAWSRLRAAPLFERVATRVVTGFFEVHGGKPVAVLLREFGITPELVTASATAPATAVVARARQDGHLAAVIHRWLGDVAPAEPSAGAADLDRHRSIVDVHVLLRRRGRVLMLRRAGTSYGEGQLCLPSGHLERGESALEAAVREVREEVGLEIDVAALEFRHVLHRGDPAGNDRIGLFFEATRWSGEPVNAEPGKCSELVWVHPAKLPGDVIPYQAAGLAGSQGPAAFSQHDW